MPAPRLTPSEALALERWVFAEIDRYKESQRMARDYHNLPVLLDALEDEMENEAGALAKKARDAQTRALEAVKRGHAAVDKKLGVVDRINAFADAMEARNLSNGAPETIAQEEARQAGPTSPPLPEPPASSDGPGVAMHSRALSDVHPSMRSPMSQPAR